MELTECAKCRGPNWVGRLELDALEVLVTCCADCGEMSSVPDAQRSRALEIAELLQRERDRGLFETEATVEEWLWRQLDGLKGI